MHSGLLASTGRLVSTSQYAERVHASVSSARVLAGLFAWLACCLPGRLFPSLAGWQAGWFAQLAVQMLARWRAVPTLACWLACCLPGRLFSSPGWLLSC